MTTSSAQVLSEGHAPSARERFLARIVEQCFADKWRSAEEFLQAFPPESLLRGIEWNEPLRVKLLVATTGVNEKLAARKTLESATEDLVLSLDEGLTSPSAILTLYPTQALVRHLDARGLWAFATASAKAKTVAKERSSRERRARRAAFIVDAALQEGILQLRDVTDGLGFRCIATSLPHAELQRIVEHALSGAREGQRLTEEQLLEAVPLETLMKHVPLDRTWQQVVVERLAIPLGLVEGGVTESDRPTSGSQPPPASGRPPLPPARLPTSLPPVPDSSPPSGIPRVDPALLPPSLLQLRTSFQGATPDASPAPNLLALSEDDSEETAIHDELGREELPTLFNGEQQVSDVAPRGEATGELARVCEALEHLRRLPPTATELSLVVLLSIESMYEELSQATNDFSRTVVIQEAFPNIEHLRIAMIALIRLLDPDHRTADSVLQTATTETLIQTLLFEERRLRELSAQDPQAPPPSTAPPQGTLS